VGPHVNLTKCPYCQEARYRGDGKPRKKYIYIPIIPRLISFAGNRRIAEQMQYRARDHKHTPGSVNDVFDGSHYRSLQGQHVELNGRKFSHRYFGDHRDIALGLSADGFSPFRKRKQTVWAFILFIYNLPPEVRFHVKNILALGVIGPKKPVDPNSFLWPAIQEFLRLLVGVRAFDILASQIFSLRAFLILVFGDIPAIALLMRMKGHNGISPCRMCKIIGIRSLDLRVTTHYVPLDRSCHPDV
jgi:Transposase family tnp2